MPFFRTLGPDSSVRDILRLNPAAGRALIEYHLAVMRQPSPLSVAERELIAAYVSGLNQCQYCHGVHTETARAFGLPDDAVARLVADLDTAPVEPRLRPLLRYVRTLTLNPATLVQADADAVLAAGWEEQALHDAIAVGCLFSFMNRLLDGHGVKGHAELYRARGAALRQHGYAPLLEALGP